MVIGDSVTEPGESHVHRLGPFGFDSAVGQADGTFVITKNRGRGLGIANVACSRAVKTGGPRIAVSGTEFRVSSRRNSDGNAGGVNVNRVGWDSITCVDRGIRYIRVKLLNYGR